MVYVLQREKPALCFQGQKSALLTESTRMNGPFSAAFFPPLSEGEHRKCVERRREEVAGVNYQSALHLKVIRILHFFCEDQGRKTLGALG